MTLPHLLFAVEQHAPVAQRRICLLSSLLCLIGLLLPASSFAQGQPGIPPFGSFSGPPDTINLANLNVHYTIPVVHKPGRGTNFIYDLTYDSYVWMPVVSGSTASWQPGPGGWNGGIIGYITYYGSPSNCYVFPSGVYYYDQFTNFVFHDPQGTLHSLPGQITAFNQDPPSGSSSCPTANYSIGGATTDGSGLTYSISTTQQNYNSITSGGIGTPDGAIITAPAANFGGGGSGAFVDRNGNQITQDGSGHFYDTLSSTTPVLTMAGSGTPSSPVTYTYTPPAGGSASYTVKYGMYTLKTNFGCSGIAEYGPTSYYLVSEVDLPDGSKYTFSYEPTPGYSGDVTGRIHQVTLPTGGTMTYAYSNGHNGINCSDGSTALLTRTTPDGTWSYYQVKGAGAASTTTVTDPSGNVTTAQFQGIYETQRVVKQGSSTTLLTTNTCYNGASSPCTGTAIALPITQRTVTSQLGASAQSKSVLSYNNIGLLTEEDDYDFPSATALLKKTIVSYGVDASPHQVTVQNGAGATVSQTTYNYDETTPTPTSGTPQHGTGYNSGNLTSINYPTGGLTSHFTYYDTGTINTSTDVNGAVTTYNYSGSSCGNAFPTSVSEPLSLSRSMTWNCTGGVQLTATDENNQTTKTTYSDPYFWRPANTSYPDGGFSTYGYDDAVPYPTFTLCNEITSSGNYACQSQNVDGLNRPAVAQKDVPTSTCSSGATTLSRSYDTNGRLLSMSNPFCTTSDSTFGTAYYYYDPLNRITSITLPDGSGIGASYSGNTLTVTDPAGKKRQITFDALGRATKVVEDPSGAAYTTTYIPDALGNITNVTQNGSRQRTFSYDSLSRLTSENNPETGTMTYRYDADGSCSSPNSFPGQLVSRTDARGIRTCMQYDTLNRLTVKNYSDGTPTATFTYDASSASGVTGLTNTKGRLIQAANPNATVVNSYDPTGRISQQWQCTPVNCGTGGWFSFVYAYNLLGEQTTVESYSFGCGSNCNNGEVLYTQAYDSAGRITSLTSSINSPPNYPPTLVSGVTYNPGDLITSMSYGNGLTESRSYNTQFQPCRFNLNSSATTLANCASAIPTGNVQDFNYSFNAGTSDNGNVASFAGTGQQKFNRSFTYDNLNRLGTMSDSNTSQQCRGLSWTYDAWGNRTDQTVTAGTCNAFHQTFNANNQLIGSPYRYDSAGDMTQDASHTYSFDAESRLTKVDNGSTATYLYDALGRRVEAITPNGGFAGATQVHYWYDTAGHLRTMWDQHGNWLTDHFYLGGQYLGSYSTFWTFKDLLGSARILTNSDKSVKDSIDYLPYGEQQSGSYWTNLKFTGNEHDIESGLEHTQFRQYSSSTGAWMHPDPAGLTAVDPSNPQSWNRYAYVINNPLAWTDPFGLDPCPNDNSWGAQLCKQAQAFASTFYINTWNQFTLLQTALTPTGSVPNPDCPNGDCAPGQQTIPVYGNIGLLSLLGRGNGSWAWNFTKSFVKGWFTQGLSDQPGSCTAVFLNSAQGTVASAARSIGSNTIKYGAALASGLANAGPEAEASIGAMAAGGQLTPAAAAVATNLVTGTAPLAAAAAPYIVRAGAYGAVAGLDYAAGKALYSEISAIKNGQCKP